MTDRSQARLWTLDVFRGAAIVLVVLMHAYFDPPWWAPADQAYAARFAYFIGHTVVPLFFLISGFLFAREGGIPAKALLRRKAVTILAPSLAWSAVAVAIRVHALGLDGTQAAIDFALLNAGGQFFYIFVLLALFLLALPLRTVSRGRLLVLAATLAAGGFARTVLLERDWPSSNLGAMLAYRDPLLWGGYFVLGMAAAASAFRYQRRVFAGAAVTGAALIAGWFVQGASSGGFADSYFSPFVYAFGWLLVVAALPALSLRGELPSRALAPLGWLGRHSFAIFLAHVPLFIGMVTDAWYPEAALDDYAQRVLFRFAVGLAGPIALVLLAQRVLPARLARYTGFPGREPRSGRPREASRNGAPPLPGRA